MGLIIDDYQGRRCQLTEKELGELSFHLQRNICLSANKVVAHIKDYYKVLYTLSGATELIHRIGFSYKKPKAVPGKAKKDEQELFILEYYRLKQEGLKIYFTDSTHPQNNPVISYGWIKKGKNLGVLPHNNSRYLMNINGAVDIESLEVVTRSCDRVNTPSIYELIRGIRAKNPTGERIRLIMDNGSYNWALEVF